MAFYIKKREVLKRLREQIESVPPEAAMTKCVSLDAVDARALFRMAKESKYESVPVDLHQPLVRQRKPKENQE